MQVGDWESESGKGRQPINNVIKEFSPLWELQENV